MCTVLTVAQNKEHKIYALLTYFVTGLPSLHLRHFPFTLATARVARMKTVENKQLCDVLMTNEMHNSYNQFLFHIFIQSCLQHDCIKLCSTVYYAVLLMMND